MTPFDADAVRVSVTGYAKDMNTSRTLPVGHVIADIRSGKYRTKVEAIRERYQKALTDNSGDVGAAKKAVKPLKERLPGIMWNGVFNKRGNAHLKTYSHLVCADLDVLEPKVLERLLAQLRHDPYVLTAFRSPTGTGLKVVFRVAGDAEQHLGNCLAACRT